MSSSGLASTAAIIIGREIGAGHKDRVYGVGLALNTLAAVGGAALGLALWLVLVFLAPTYVFPLFKLSAGAAARGHYDDYSPGGHHAAEGF